MKVFRPTVPRLLLAATLLATLSTISSCKSARPQSTPIHFQNLRHTAIGNAILEVEGTRLVVSNLGRIGTHGVAVEIPDANRFDLLLEPVRIAPGSEFRTTVTASVDGSTQDVMIARHRGLSDDRIALDMGLERAARATVEYYLDGNLVFTEEKTSEGQNIWWIPVVVYVVSHTDGHYESETTTTTDADGAVTTTTTTSWAVTWEPAAAVTTTSGEEIRADLIRIRPEAIPLAISPLRLKLTGSGLDSFSIVREEMQKGGFEEFAIDEVSSEGV